MLDLKISFNKYKNIYILQRIFSKHNSTKIEISFKKYLEISLNRLKLDNLLVNYPRAKEEITRGFVK